MTGRPIIRVGDKTTHGGTVMEGFSSYIQIGCATVAGLLCALTLFWYFCRPVVVIHYSAAGGSPIGYFYDTDVYLARRTLHPGESAMYYTDWHHASDYWTSVSLPAESGDHVEVNGPFSRVDVYVGPDAKVQRTTIRHGFFARFSEPSEPCEPTAHEPNDNGSPGR